MTDSQTPPPHEPSAPLTPPPYSAPQPGQAEVPPAYPTAPPVPASAPSAHSASAPSPEAAPSASAPVTPDALDAGTYSALRTPRSASALALDGTWHQISPRWVASQFLQNGLFLALVIVVMLVMAFAFEQAWVWIPGGIVILFTLITLIILPRQAKATGYMLRADDIVFRRGILWQRMVAVPYGRLQLVDITHGPLDRAFGVSQLKMVTAAATTGVQIPGLTQPAAEALRDTLIEVAETRRTGL
ncbi:transmembrane protein, distant homology with ydbS [Microbacterium esteraromaticum]|uniref:Transmembrane protein, distant homology with ydbS n=1 Tax=Microbacterium esteraromaticum TaxID=57043 RepID=A0A1R4KP41_9MICO|nr:transmembrane protein, distant homology with ydbS [Microbacterium esteraromaticum]